MSEANAPTDLIPHDRVVFFSDAVFAIAITLLAIELRLPSGNDGHAVAEFVSLSIAYVISFLVTALFWANHMQSWRRVKHVSGGLLWLNIFQLLFVALMPFVTNVYSQVFRGTVSWPLALYCFVLTGVSFFGFLQHRLITRQELRRGEISAGQAKVEFWGSISALCVFATTGVLSFFVPPWAGSLFFMAILPLDAFLTRWARRRYTPPVAD